MTDKFDVVTQPLLYEQIFTLTTKSIKKIIISGKSDIRINKFEGFSMCITSNSLISCKINKNILYIESYKKSSCLCFGIDVFNSINRGNFSDTWKINAVFIIEEIIVNGNSSMTIDSGFDKRLKCIKNGNYGKIILNKLYVSYLYCNVSKGSIIEFNDSVCSDFVAVVSGMGKIITPMIQNTANITVDNFGQVNCVISNYCIITKKCMQLGKVNIKKLNV